MCFYWLEITVWSNLSLEHFGELNKLHSTRSQGAVKTPPSVPTRQAWEAWHNRNDTHKDVLSKKIISFHPKYMLQLLGHQFLYFIFLFFSEYSCIVCFSVYFVSELRENTGTCMLQGTGEKQRTTFRFLPTFALLWQGPACCFCCCGFHLLG